MFDPEPFDPGSCQDVILFDLCDTTMPPSGVTAEQTPPEPLLELFRRLRYRYLLMPVTGQVDAVVRKLEEDIGIKKFWVSGTEFGARIHYARPENSGHHHLPGEHREALWHVHAKLLEWVKDTGGAVDPRPTNWFFSFWWHDRDSYAKAQGSQTHLLEILNRELPNWGEQIEWGWGSDGSSWCKPKFVGKHLVHPVIDQQGYRVRVAAGDSPSDIPLMERAEFGIVCHGAGHRPNRDLIAAAKRCPRGYYVASENEVHGHGFHAGLHAARAASVITF